MGELKTLITALASFPCVEIGHVPTRIEKMKNLGADLGINLFVKRDDCTGIGLGGNKVRQLEYYFGQAQAENADAVLITGAVQSNFVRTTAAFAGLFNMECHIQLEERVKGMDALYRTNGNVLLNHMLGAHMHSYPDGEDEAGADAALAKIARDLASLGKRPFVIPLGADHPPLGALGYVAAALEFAEQMARLPEIDQIIIPSGSGLTHIGLLFGLRALGVKTEILGICVRRDATAQKVRLVKRAEELAQLMALPNPIINDDIKVFDGVLAPGYGQPSFGVEKAMKQTAHREGIFLDPVYSGKAMAGLMKCVATENMVGQNVLFWHTGGFPAVFAYASTYAS